MDKNVVRMAQEVQKLEDDISAALNDQTTLQKSQVSETIARASPLLQFLSALVERASLLQFLSALVERALPCDA